jgi:hypothetical protein
VLKSQQLQEWATALFMGIRGENARFSGHRFRDPQKFPQMVEMAFEANSCGFSGLLRRSPLPLAKRMAKRK